MCVLCITSRPPPATFGGVSTKLALRGFGAGSPPHGAGSTRPRPVGVTPRYPNNAGFARHMVWRAVTAIPYPEPLCQRTFTQNLAKIGLAGKEQDTR